MAQFDFGNLESPLSGEDFVNGNLEPWRDALHTLHSGITRPSYVVQNMVWLDTSASPYRVKMFDGSEDVVLFTVDFTTNKVGLVGATIDDAVIGGTTPNVVNATNINYSGEIAYTSDRRWKKDIHAIGEAFDPLEVILKLTPVSFRFKKGGNRRNFGLIAQDVKEVIPDIVSEGEDGKLSLHGMDLVGVLIGAVQVLTERVKQLEEKDEKLS